MKTETTHQTNDTTVSSKLYLALELSNAEWKLGFTIGLGQTPRLRILKARNLDGLEREIELAKERFRLPKEVAVFSCYEARRDGFWLHRFLEANGVNNLVVDSASRCNGVVRLSKVLVHVSHSIHDVESVCVLLCTLDITGGSLHTNYISCQPAFGQMCFQNH